MDLNYYFLYFDMSTIKCTTEDIDNTLRSFAKDYRRINNSSWIFTYPNEFDGHFTCKEDYLIDEHFDCYFNENSIFFIVKLKEHYNYQLPDEVCDFIDPER